MENSFAFSIGNILIESREWIDIEAESMEELLQSGVVCYDDFLGG